MIPTDVFYLHSGGAWPNGFEPSSARRCKPSARGQGRCATLRHAADRQAAEARCGPRYKHDATAPSSERLVPIDVYETANELTINADVPGITKDRIVIEILDGKLHLSVGPASSPATDDTRAGVIENTAKPAEEPAPSASPEGGTGAQKRTHEEVRWHRQEISRRYGKRVVKLPDNVDGDKISASLECGVLTVKVPLMEIKTKRVVIS